MAKGRKAQESLQKKEAIATLAHVLCKHSRPMQNLRNFWDSCNASCRARPSKSSHSNHSRNECQALSSPGPSAGQEIESQQPRSPTLTTAEPSSPGNRLNPPCFSVQVTSIDLQVSPSYTSHPSTAQAVPKWYCVYSFVKGNAPRSSQRDVLSQREVQVTCH